VDKDFSEERDIVVEKPVDEVFEYIRYLRNQDSYSDWAGLKNLKEILEVEMDDSD
jgi:uncharacterized membrane protein